MNQFERDIGGRPAILEYLDGEYRVVSPGSYVVCAVTGTKIPLEALRYWSVDLAGGLCRAGCRAQAHAGKGSDAAMSVMGAP